MPSKQYNKFTILENYVIGETVLGETFKIDKEDLFKVAEFYWRFNDNGYLYTQIGQRGQRKSIRLHRFIMNVLEKEEIIIDHIDRDKSNNIKKNLREVNKSQNAMNTKVNANSSSGIKGVRWISSKNKWRAEIKVDYKNIYLGYFTTKEEAQIKRLEAEKKFFGEYRAREDL